jgi:hypothetical protein
MDVLGYIFAFGIFILFIGTIWAIWHSANESLSENDLTLEDKNRNPN